MFLDEYDEFDLNYDLDKIPQYVLPDPLLSSDGYKIKSFEEWEQIQRKKLIKLFSNNLYGEIPGKFKNIEIITKSIDKNFFNSLATKKEVRIKFEIRTNFNAILKYPISNELQ